MNIFQVDINASSMSQDIIEHELSVIGDLFAAIGGELIHADAHTANGSLIAYVRAETEVMVSDIFEASPFAVEAIA